MDLEQAERFVAAAEHDHAMAVAWYCTNVEERTEGEGLRALRADVLAAQQVLDLARNELLWQQVCTRQREEAAARRVRQDAAAALRARDDTTRERRQRKRADRTALDQPATETGR